MNLDELRKKMIESQKSQNEIALSTLRLLITEIKRLQGLDEEELNWQGITKEKRDQLVKELSVVFDKA